jgi:hypothetical protein
MQQGMTLERLIGYLLNALEHEDALAVERSLAGEDETRRQLDLLRFALVPLEGDCGDVDAPAGLAACTCRRIRAATTTGQTSRPSVQ